MPFDFSGLAPRSESVTGPDRQSYRIRNATADAAIRFRAANMAGQRLDKDGKVVGFGKEYIESELILVAASLCHDDPELTQVPYERAYALVAGWDSKVMKDLYEWVVDNSPGLLTRTREGLLEERARIDRVLAAMEAKHNDPKVLPPSTGTSST